MVIAWMPMLLLACRPDAVDLSQPDEGPPRIRTESLPDAHTHQAYTVWLEADAGVPPLTWTASPLPPGLVVNPAGALTGVPLDKGTTELTFTVTDGRGRTDEVELPLKVKWAEGSVGCGQSRSGTFDDVAAVDFYEVDWEAEGGWTRLEIPLPEPEVTTITIDVGAFYADTYLALPGTPEGDRDLDNYSWEFAFPGYPVVIDLGTWPDLESYRAYGEPIQLLLAAEVPEPWGVAVECLDIPVVTSTYTSPTRLGEPLAINYSVHGEQADVTWALSGDLPSWATFDPESGRISGVAQELGTWTYTLEVTDLDGGVTTATSGFGVYEPVPIACDQTFTWTPHGYFEGDLIGSSDPDGFRVFELQLDRSVSGVTAWLDATSGGEVGLADPDGSTPWSPAAPRVWDFSPALLSVEVSPSTWPPVGAWDDMLHAVARPYYDGPPDVSFWLECDPLPRPELAALPVLEVGLDAQRALSAIGGTPPYTWSAQGLPPEVTLDVAGVLDATAPLAGTWDLDVRVVDALGAQTLTPLTLYAGDAEACLGHPVLGCGEAFADDLSAGAALTLCVPPEAAAYDLVVFTADPISATEVDVFTTHPGSEPGSWDRWIIGARNYDASAAVIDHTDDPPLSAYTDLPMFVDVQSTGGGSFELQLECL